ncbi:hypothetical protein BG011_001785 [Mortierella polycephala]|uniref:TATA element modulatory factor 1 TATA binding domain-containing protein n=1 Tax=Mortierella polycephala TaxID=41804 RepID=A0A9P6UAE3_9FUNG|nr:hypothetical protein BG011_001785 [Mortierella polycephala]
MQQQAFNPKDYPIVMAIDFGTTFSGCAYAYAQDDKEVIDITAWPKHTIQYPKTPTLNLYKKDDPSHTMVAWGMKAKLETMKPTAKHHILLSQYKLHLDEHVHNSALEVGITVLEAISQYLEAFHEYVVGEVMRGFARNFQRDHFRYCLTVPAMWSDRAKNVMRQAAVQAKLIKETDHPDRLMLISEPEAAALYCERKCDHFDLGNGDRFMICDAGGGTVDLIVFEISVTSAGRRLSEVTKGHGASCGSVFLDRHMRRLLEQKFGHHAANFPANIIPNLTWSSLSLMELPAHRCFDDLEDPEAIGIDDGYLVLSAAELKENVFEPVVKDVLSLIQEQLTLARNCSAIFLVGGFGSSNYLFSRVNAQFSSQVPLISIPPRPELAVVRGAVCVGLNPRVVTARIARRCYGISSDQPFEKGKDPLAKRKFEVNGVWCIDRFSPYVKQGQKLNVDECISREFSFTKFSEAPEDYNIALYAAETDGDPPRYTTDAGVSKLADIPIPCPHQPSSRLGSMVKVKIKMYFGLNEIRAEAAVGDKVGASGGGGGGWGSFLKQGLSSIESKLDMVLDMQVPIPGGSSTLTSFSPHSIVLPPEVTGATSGKDIPPEKQASAEGESGIRDEAATPEDHSARTSGDSSKRVSTSTTRPTVISRDSAQDLRKSSSSTAIRESMDEAKASNSRKEDPMVTVDPFTGMVTTAPGIKRMSTPPISRNSSAAMSAAANRERLEQRMRGIFKKPTESPPSTPPHSSSMAPSPVASPSPSFRKLVPVEPKEVPQEQKVAEKVDESEDKAATPLDSTNVALDDKPLVSEVSEEQEQGATLTDKPATTIKEADPEEASKEVEDKDADAEADAQDTNQDPENKDSEESNESDDLKLESEVEIADDSLASISEDTLKVSETEITEEAAPEAPSIQPAEDDIQQPSMDEPESINESDDVKDQNIQDVVKTMGVSKDNLAQLLITPDGQATISPPVETVDRSYTPTAMESNQPEAASDRAQQSSVLIEDQGSTPTKANSKSDTAAADENPLKRVVEQREEQLFKVMQEQSSLLEKLRDLEDAKTADDSVQATKIAGLEKMIETQKKELEVARGSNLASQPKSIQKTLEEQRALLEDKDEQIRGLLTEGEVLSKKEFKYLTTIKTLRTKNIEAEKLQMDTQKKLDKVSSDHTDATAKLAKLMEENKQLNDAVKSMQDTNQRQNKQMNKMETELVQLREDKAEIQLGLDRAWQELEEARKSSAELSNQTHAASLEREKKMNEELQDEMDALKAQHAAIESNLRQDIQELRVSLSNREEQAGEKEDQLWMEIRSLQARLEQNDNDSFELQETLDEARRPLLRQIEALQNQLGTANRNWDKIEKSLAHRVTDAEEDVVKAQERERSAREKLDEMKSQNVDLEARLETLRIQDAQLRSEVIASKRSLTEKEDAARQAQADLSREHINRERAIEEAKEDVERKWRRQQNAEVEKLKQHIQQLQQRQGDHDESASGAGSEAHLSAGMSTVVRRPSSSSITSALSPMLSGGHLMMGGSKSSAPASGGAARTSLESVTSPLSLDGMPPAMSRSTSSHTVQGMSAVSSSVGLMGLGNSSTGPAVAMERLSTMVRQLEGQVAFLSEQVRTANRNKDELSDELVRVTMEVEELQKAASRLPITEQELGLLQERHRAALEMLGERTEEVQELRADILDVKEAYRDQINELLAQLEKARRANVAH